MTARGRKAPTCTTLVYDALKGSDDFMNYSMLREATGCSQGQLHAACCHLRAHRAVDAVVNPDGTAWWFATPGSDDRMRELRERAEEFERRRPRKQKIKSGGTR